MKKQLFSLLSVLLAIFLLLAIVPGRAQESPQSYYIKSRPVCSFEAVLTEKIVTPHITKGTLNLYAPIIPVLPGQKKVNSKFRILSIPALPISKVHDQSILKRPLYKVSIRGSEFKKHQPFAVMLHYEGILYERHLTPGKSNNRVKKLTPVERKAYIASSAMMDLENRELRKWMHQNKLMKSKKESTINFARRVYNFLAENGAYSTSKLYGYNERKPSNTIKKMTGDCGSFSLLFVSILRINQIPARSLFGRWAKSQLGDYGECHVKAEFYRDMTGWIPVDVTSAINDKKNLDNYFGNDNGFFITMHIDTDVVAEKGFWHGWAQYLLHNWQGGGDYWKDFENNSRWKVTWEKT